MNGWLLCPRGSQMSNPWHPSPIPSVRVLTKNKTPAQHLSCILRFAGSRKPHGLSNTFCRMKLYPFLPVCPPMPVESTFCVDHFCDIALSFQWISFQSAVYFIFPPYHMHHRQDIFTNFARSTFFAQSKFSRCFFSPPPCSSFFLNVPLPCPFTVAMLLPAQPCNANNGLSAQANALRNERFPPMGLSMRCARKAPQKLSEISPTEQSEPIRASGIAGSIFSAKRLSQKISVPQLGTRYAWYMLTSNP